MISHNNLYDKSSSWQHFSINLYKLFLFYIVGTLLNIAKLRNVSKSLHSVAISQSTNSTLKESLIFLKL